MPVDIGGIDITSREARNMEVANVIQSGLVCHLDASIFNEVAFGSTWYDLSGNGNHGTITGATWASNDGGVVRFDGVNDRVDISSGLDYRYTTSTVMGASRYINSTSGNGRLISSYHNNWIMGHHSGGSSTVFYANATVYWPAGADLNWRVYGFSGDYSNDLWTGYVNGSAVVTNSTAGVEGPNGLGLGYYKPGNSEWANGEIASVLVYDRILSASEVAYNTSIMRRRLGI